MDSFINWLTSGLPGLVVGFCGLVFIHELGHYLLAKWNGVRVHVFSIGMGPYIFSFTKGETVYALSLVPLGGYVKLAGQDDMRPALEASQDPKDYRNKTPGQRAQILAAGAIFNLISAFMLFTFVYFVGVEFDWTRIGEIDKKAPMANAYEKHDDGKITSVQFLPGDKIIAVNGEEVKTIMEIQLEVASAGVNQEVLITYQRPKGGTPLATDDPVYFEKQYAFVKTKKDEETGGAKIGLTPFRPKREYKVGFTTEGSKGIWVTALIDDKKSFPDGNPAKAAGMQVMDHIVTIDGLPVENADQFSRLIREGEDKMHDLIVERKGKPVTLKIRPVCINPKKEEKIFMLGIGLVSDTVMEIDPESEAAKQGLKKGAVLTLTFENKVKKTLEIGFIDPETFKEEKDEKENKDNVKTFTLSLEKPSTNSLVLIRPLPDKHMNKAESFGGAIAMGWSDLKRHCMAVFKVVKGLISGNISFKALSGPIGIAGAISGVASSAPIMNFLWFLAFISVNLGMMQFMPIPLLDGWHLLMVFIEKIKGTPVSPKLQEYFQYVGLFMLLCLLVFATWNDLGRMFGLTS